VQKAFIDGTFAPVRKRRNRVGKGRLSMSSHTPGIVAKAAMSTGAGSHVLQNAVPTAAPSVRRAGRFAR